METANRICSEVRSRFREQVPALSLDDTDWRRFEFASRLVRGRSAADIGTGHGVMIHILDMMGRHDRIAAVDIKTHSQALRIDGVNYIEKSIAAEDWDVPASDTVICMEVLEHLEAKFNPIMLKNLRSIAKERLVLTVPFNEPEPLWWHDKPGGHRQKFTLEKLGELFPSAIATIQPRYGVEWVFVVEDKDMRLNGFRMVPKKDFLNMLEM